MKRKILMLLGLIFIPLVIFGASVTTMLSAVTGTGASSSMDIASYDRITFHIVATDVSSGATFQIQTTLDGTSYATIHTETITSNGTTEIAVNGFKYRHIRINLSAYTDGTYTVKMIKGR